MSGPGVADLPLALRVEQAAEVLGIGRSAAYAAIRAGELPSIRIGRRVLVPRAGLLRLLGEAPIFTDSEEWSGAPAPEPGDDDGIF